MDIKQATGHRYRTHHLIDDTTETKKYDYERNGILTKSLPRILFRGNTILTTFLQMIDLRLIIMFKYIDRIKRFKWATWY